MATRHRWKLLANAFIALLAVAIVSCPAVADDARRQQIGDAVRGLMEKHEVPGASVAVIDDYAIDWADGYGRLVATREEKVTPETMFQAASISKPVAATAVLTLVQEGKLDLDTKVNDLLTTWKIPDSTTTEKHPILLRHLLSHSAGLTVHGFPGYAQYNERPTLVQILDGEKPANSDAIRPFMKAGYAFKYSGGGYCVLQQLAIDIAGLPFPELMQTRVLGPLDMSHSTYEQPLPKTRSEPFARGHREEQKMILGGCHVYPEVAAAGLWTTPSDLAQFAIDLSKSHAKDEGKLLSQQTARQMLTVEKGSYGLGLALRGEGESLRFSHGGANAGYRCYLLAYPATGQGLAIMTNSDTGSAMFNDVAAIVRELYEWPER